MRPHPDASLTVHHFCTSIVTDNPCSLPALYSAAMSPKKAIPDDDKRDPQRLSKVVERSDSFVKKMEEFARQRTLSEEREHGLLEDSLGVDSSGVTGGSGSEEK